MSKIFFGLMALLIITLLSTINHPLKGNNIVQLAIQTVRIQAGLSEEVELKLVEKRESPIRDFIMVKLLVVGKDGEVPIVVYVDRSAEKVILGDLFIRGENITLKETGDPRTTRIGSRSLETGKASLSY
jgi:hypothetical protein